MSITIRPPKPAEMEAYYQLRHDVLRRPWGQVKGTERAEDDETAYHAAAFSAEGNLIGVGRLHLNSATEGQVRFMAVAAETQGLGVGNLVMEHLEDHARTMGATKMILHARQNAVPFYEKLGYHITAKSYLLFDEIQHWEMAKRL